MIRLLVSKILLRMIGILAKALGRVIPRDLDENGKDRRTGSKLGGHG